MHQELVDYLQEEELLLILIELILVRLHQQEMHQTLVIWLTSHHGTGFVRFNSWNHQHQEISWSSNNSNRIDFVTIASTGNANDFGDLYFGTREWWM